MFSTDLKNLKIQYRTTVNQVIDEFYVPVLRKAVECAFHFVEETHFFCPRIIKIMLSNATIWSQLTSESPSQVRYPYPYGRCKTGSDALL